MRDVIYEMSSWTRAIVIPLAIVQRTPEPPAGFNLDELIKPGVDPNSAITTGSQLADVFIRSIAFKFWYLWRGPVAQSNPQARRGFERGFSIAPSIPTGGGYLPADDVPDDGARVLAFPEEHARRQARKQFER